MIIIDLLEELRKKLGMLKKDFYNIILGNGMKYKVSDKEFIINDEMPSHEVTRFLTNCIPGHINERFQKIENDNLYNDLVNHYKKYLILSNKEQEKYLNALKQKFKSVGIDIGVDTDDFYLYLAHTVYYYIFNDLPEETYKSFIPNDEPIYDQMMRIFNDDNINYIVIATQVGMILVTNDSVRMAVTEYLKKGKTLEVIINSAEIRNAVGAHMRNPSISHQTDTGRVCELWKEIKQEVGKANLMVGTTDLPMLHQIIKTSKIVNGTEQNISIEVRMYAYKVRNKDDNIAFTLTTMSDKYKIIDEELEYLRIDAISEFIIAEQISQRI